MVTAVLFADAKVILLLRITAGQLMWLSTAARNSQWNSIAHALLQERFAVSVFLHTACVDSQTFLDLKKTMLQQSGAAGHSFEVLIDICRHASICCRDIWLTCYIFIGSLSYKFYLPFPFIYLLCLSLCLALSTAAKIALITQKKK